MTDVYIYIYIYILICHWPNNIYIYIVCPITDAPPWGLSTLAKEFSDTARIMQSSSKELSTLVVDRV